MFKAGTKIPHPYNDIRKIVTVFQNPPPFKALHPRYWPVWLGIAILRIMVFLPFRIQFATGASLGRLLYRYGRRRRHIASVNLALCFPDLSDAEREKILVQHFESLGIALFEAGLAWWASNKRLEKLVSGISGLEHVRAALASGRGVIMLTAHFTCLEIGGRLFGIYLPFQALYRTHENPALQYLIQKYRNMHLGKAIPRENIRAMLKTLKDGKAVWYLQDQNFGHKNKVFVPFFGVEAATTPATSRMARFSNAVVIPCFARRNEDYSGYQLTILPPLDDFPGEDDVQDTARIARIIEQEVRKSPAQYLWSHRRFKDRPEGQDSFY
jgi:KDO2-lipid IV(A) lauroyltransferase